MVIVKTVIINTIIVNAIVIIIIIVKRLLSYLNNYRALRHAKASDPGVALSLAGRYQHKHFQ
jgi:hypothetical protein